MSEHVSEMQQKMKELTQDDWLTLIVAGIVGVAALAVEFERLDLSTEQESLQDARELRPYVMAGIEAVRTMGEQ